MYKKKKTKSCHTILRQIFPCGKKSEISTNGLHEKLFDKIQEEELEQGSDAEFAKFSDLAETRGENGLYVSANDEEEQKAKERSSTSNEKQLLFTWMFVFRLPSGITPEEQQAFERTVAKEARLHKRHVEHERKRQGKACDEHARETAFTSFDVIHKGFENFVELRGVEDMMRSELSYLSHETSPAELEKLHVPTNWPVLHQRVLAYTKGKDISKGSSSDATFREPCDSFRRAVQSSIEITLAFFADLERSSGNALATYAGSQVSGSRCSGSPMSGRAERPSSISQKYIHVFSFTSNTKDTLHMCVRLEREVAEHLADLAEYPVQLSEQGVRDLGIELDFGATSPAYVKYDNDFRDKCRKWEDPFQIGEQTVLRPIDHTRLLYDKITDYIDLNYLRTIGILQDSFPLHHIDQVQYLRREWGDYRLLFVLDQPLDKVRDYFGEEITFYFAFCQHLIKGLAILLVPAVGCSFWEHLLTDGTHTGHSNLAMSVIIMLWNFCFQKSWQRREAQIANEWGLAQHAFSTVKRVRNKHFDGELMPSPENQNRKSLQVPRSTEVIGRTMSLLLTSIFVVLMIALNAVEWGTYYWLILPIESSGSTLGQIISVAVGCFSGTQIKVVDSIWDGMSNWITTLECRGFEDEFNWSKSIKTTVVRFINTVSMMFFFGFVHPIAESFSCDSAQQCAQIRVTNRVFLSTKLTTAFVTRFFLLSIFNDVLKPEFHLFLKVRQAKRAQADLIKEHRAIQRETAFTELQANMDTYGNAELTNDYLDVMLPFSFVILFGMISPLTVVGCWLICLVQVRQDAWKLLHLFQRPFPRLVKDIGSFNGMLASIGNLMIFSNLGLLFVDCNLLEIVSKALGLAAVVNFAHTSWTFTAFFFTLGTMLLTLLWHFMDFVVSDTSSFLQLEKRRQNMQRHHLFFSASGGPHEVKKRDVVLKEEFLDNRVDFSNCSSLKVDGNHELVGRSHQLVRHLSNVI